MSHMVLREANGTVLAEGDGAELIPTAKLLYLRARRKRANVLRTTRFPGGTTYHVTFGRAGEPGSRVDTVLETLVARWDGPR